MGHCFYTNFYRVESRTVLKSRNTWPQTTKTVIFVFLWNTQFSLDVPSMADILDWLNQFSVVFFCVVFEVAVGVYLSFLLPSL